MSCYSILSRQTLQEINQSRGEPFYSSASITSSLKRLFIQIQNLFSSFVLSWGSVSCSTKSTNKSIKELKNRVCVGPSAVLGYFETFLLSHPNVQLFQGLFPNQATFRQQITKRNIKLIPFCIVVKGMFRDHIIGGAMDLEKNRLEFFDPKGVTIKGHKGSQLRHFDHLEPHHFIQRILLLYGNKNTTIIQNTQRHQKDVHNCGIYVSNYLKRRIQDQQEAEEIFSNPITLQQANNDFRMEMIQAIEGALPSSTEFVEAEKNVIVDEDEIGESPLPSIETSVVIDPPETEKDSE